MEIIDKLTEILSDYRGTKTEITESTTFEDLQFDSLDKVELLMKIEEEFGFQFADDLQIANIGELINAIQAQR